MARRSNMLTGKVRTAQKRARSTRRFADRLIAEYDQPTLFDIDPIREIPVHIGADRLSQFQSGDSGAPCESWDASAWPADKEWSDARHEAETLVSAHIDTFKTVNGRGTPDVERSRDMALMNASTDRGSPSDVSPRVPGEASDEVASTKTQPIRTTRSGARMDIFERDRGAAKPGEFTIRGLCIGLAFGTAAASVILVLVSVLAG